LINAKLTPSSTKDEGRAALSAIAQRAAAEGADQGLLTSHSALGTSSTANAWGEALYAPSTDHRSLITDH
jgi:hypothetical protein